MGDEATEPKVCANCKTPLQGEYCHRCGQRDKDYLRNVLGLIADFVQELSEWDSRFWRSLFPLLFRPGFLSNEWVAGRRMHYVSPVRLYIFISIAFFLVFAMVVDFDADAVRAGLGGDAAAEEPADENNITMDLPFLGEVEQERIKSQIKRLKANPDIAFKQALSLAPQMMFALLPLFALILKFLYLFSRRYYTEHLLLAVHTHSFLYLAFLFLIAFDGIVNWAEASPGTEAWIGRPAGWLIVLLWFWMPVYLFLAQKAFYRQGWFMTAIKYSLTGLIYFFTLGFALAGLMVVTLLTA